MYFAVTTLAHTFIWFWYVWGLMFAAIEFSAMYLRRKDKGQDYNGGTLSEIVWRAIRGYGWKHRIGMILFLIFWGWLTLHFVHG